MLLAVSDGGGVMEATQIQSEANVASATGEHWWVWPGPDACSPALVTGHPGYSHHCCQSGTSSHCVQYCDTGTVVLYHWPSLLTPLVDTVSSPSVRQHVSVSMYLSCIHHLKLHLWICECFKWDDNSCAMVAGNRVSLAEPSSSCPAHVIVTVRWHDSAWCPVLVILLSAVRNIIVSLHVCHGASVQCVTWYQCQCLCLLMLTSPTKLWVIVTCNL